MKINENIYDAIIVGGGAAGLSAATVLARAHANVVVIDNQMQSNGVTPATHGVFTRDGESPAELYRIARSQLSNYLSCEFKDGTVIELEKNGDNFVARLKDGAVIWAKTVLLAQGVQYELPEIPGLAELWGDKAWHCPFCHGYDSTDQNILVIGDTQKLAHLKQLLPRWTDKVDYQEIAKVTELKDSKEGVDVVFSDGLMKSYDGILAQTIPKPRDALADLLGCKRSKAGIILVDDLGKTSVSSVYSAGDQSSMMQQVNLAVAAGHKAGIAIIMKLQGVNL